MKFNIILWAVLCAAAFGAGMATPVNAASFDCAKATTAVEKMICGNEGLSKLDEVMADTYKARLVARPNDPSIRNDQATWLQERNKCSDDYCLVVAYLDRLKALEQRGQPTAQPPASADAELFRKYDTLNSKCRGGSGDVAAMTAACKERDRHFRVMESKGWCWGPKSAAEYQKKWQRCASEYDKSNWTLFQGNDGSRYFVDSDTRGEQAGYRIIRYLVDNGAATTWYQVAFDCSGRFQMMIPMGRQMRYFGPDSVMSHISLIACL